MKLRTSYREIGMIVILLTGMIHLYHAPGEFQAAQYMGALFFVFFLGSIVSAIGIYHDQLYWGWMLGGVLFIGAIAGYITSRTVGLPFSGREAWGPGLAYLSIFLELFFFAPFMGYIRPFLWVASCEPVNP